MTDLIERRFHRLGTQLSGRLGTPDHMLTKVESSRIVAADCRSGHILVVDDDPAVRHLISDYFGQHGIQTVSAMGRSAVARQLAGGDTSAIILDLQLGQDNGLDLLREIRSSSDVPVIILTGRSRDEVDCVVGLELGADDYLTKPFGIRELYARFRAVLRRRENGRSLRTRVVERGDTSSADGGLIVAAGASSIRRNGRLP
jgi:two-component system, OmpR family, response regulator